jgi:hypothetical protein
MVVVGVLQIKGEAALEGERPPRRKGQRLRWLLVYWVMFESMYAEAHTLRVTTVTSEKL